MKKFLLILITLLALLAVIYLTYQNKSNQTLVIYLWAGFFAGMIVDFGMCKVFNNEKGLNAYKNKYEKISVDKEEQTDKVKILEEKVKSLEIALSKALDK